MHYLRPFQTMWIRGSESISETFKHQTLQLWFYPLNTNVSLEIRLHEHTWEYRNAMNICAMRKHGMVPVSLGSPTRCEEGTGSRKRLSVPESWQQPIRSNCQKLANYYRNDSSLTVKCSFLTFRSRWMFPPLNSLFTPGLSKTYQLSEPFVV